MIAAIPGADVLVRGERSVADVTIKDLRSIAAARNAFGLDIFRLLAREDGNIVLGPDSISNALTMTYAGARGSTAAEMRSAMHLDLSDDALHRAAGALDASLLEANDIDGIEMARGTRLFGLRDFPFKESFLETLSRDYGAPLATLDFTADPDHARAVINDWVAQLTRELIPELMGPGKVTGNTRLVIVDAQYMKAVWDEPFDPDWTGDAPFHLPDGSTIDVPMMRNHLMIPIAGGDDWVAGELAYKGGRLTMLVIVPQDLASFEAHLDKDRLDSIVADLREQSYVPISLPRFEVSQHSDLVPLMRELGIEDLFGGGDLSGISDSDLWVGGVEHEAVVKVNEEGTEAAAATGAEMPGSAPAVEVRADRPFLFFVRDRHTGSILFMGRVADPRPE
ncbi:MAG TPA: serpin family protein [Candidatus Limnocylindrales bacterium]|nr:serpin family protein [Candidatus Limnocylindrales bacterium]